MPLKRLQANPLLTPDDVQPTRDDLEVLCTLNPAAVRFGGEVLLLVRVGERLPPEDDCVSYLYFDVDAGEVRVRRIARDDPDLTIRDARGCYYRGRMLLSSMSHLRIARSRDGANFTFDPEPAIFPATPYEAFGCEDARITPLDGRCYVTYTAVSDRGVTVALASTDDFSRFERHGVIFPPYQKDVCLFPRRVGGMYVCRHRPYKSELNAASIWTAFSPDLRCWGHHEMTMAPEPGTWRSDRVGCGAAPIETPAGWLEVFHAADENGHYRLGVMLSDLEHPQRVVTMSRRAVFEPQADYETTGVYGHCVFHNGLIADEDGKVALYYGAADRICAGATTTVEDLIAAASE